MSVPTSRISRACSTAASMVGNTPMLDFTKYSANPDSIRILAKAEFTNLSGSIKDRMVSNIIDEAERAGKLQPNSTIVAATSGNTGAALGAVCALRGYKYVVITNSKCSSEKRAAMAAYGGQVRIAPPDRHYEQVARDMAAEDSTYFDLDQYGSPYNAAAYAKSLAPEIVRDTDGKISHFIAGASTGGTISGVGRALKSHNSDVQVVLADPVGSVLTPAVLEKAPKDSLKPSKSWQVEGVGKDSVPGAMNVDVVDAVVPVTDVDSFFMCRRVAQEMGLLLGGSAGLNLFAATQLSAQLAARLPAGAQATIVTVLPDNGVKYMSKIYNDSWLEDQGLLSVVQERLAAVTVPTPGSDAQ